MACYDYPSFAEAVAIWEKRGTLLRMKDYAPIRASAEYPTIAEIFCLWRKRAAEVQEQRRALFFSPAHYPTVEEAVSWSTSYADQEEQQSEAEVVEEVDSWSTSYADQEEQLAEAKVVELVLSLLDASEGEGSGDDFDLSSSDARIFGSEASTMSSGFSDSSSSGQSSQEEPSTASAVNSLCCSNYRFNCYNTYSKQYSDSSLLLDLVLLLVSFTVSKNVVTAVHLASRMGLLGADQRLVRGTPAASWRLLPTRRLQPGSTRAADVKAVVVGVSSMSSSFSDSSSGAQSSQEDVKAGVVETTVLTAGVKAVLVEKMLVIASGVRGGDKAEPSSALAAPGEGFKKVSGAAAQDKKQKEQVGCVGCGERNVSSRSLVAHPGRGLRKETAAPQSKRQARRVGGAKSGVREAVSRLPAALPGGGLRAGSAAVQGKRQEGRVRGRWVNNRTTGAGRMNLHMERKWKDKMGMRMVMTWLMRPPWAGETEMMSNSSRAAGAGLSQMMTASSRPERMGGKMEGREV
ncbi:unnamed protein product [Closterium sp. Naga37s-1]|nr:unnamed protein product [Closterium sp. Naga37s-1]